MRIEYAIQFACPRCDDRGLFRFGKVHRYRCGFCEFEFEKAIARKVRIANRQCPSASASPETLPPQEAATLRRVSGD